MMACAIQVLGTGAFAFFACTILTIFAIHRKKKAAGIAKMIPNRMYCIRYLLVCQRSLVNARGVDVLLLDVLLANLAAGQEDGGEEQQEQAQEV